MLVTVFIDLRLLGKNEDFRNGEMISEEEKSGEKSSRSDGESYDFSTKSHLYISFAKYFYSIVDCRKKKPRIVSKTKRCKIDSERVRSVSRYVSHSVEDCYSE